MPEITNLLASLVHKTAIKEGKLKFLADRYGNKDLKPYLLQNELIELLPEEGDDAEQNKRINTEQLALKYNVIIKNIASADPTDAQNKNDYTEWLLKQWLAMDLANKSRWTEETPVIRETLEEFVKLGPTLRTIKEPDGSLKYSNDINKYTNIEELRKVINTLSTATERYDLPELSEPGATVLYQDGSYIFWQVTSPEDLVKLSSWPLANPAVWCTKNLDTAKSYLKTGPDYVAYKNGEPLFQIDPHDPSGMPQFLSRHNTRMHSARMLNHAAADLLSRVVAKGGLNEQAQKDLDYVLSVYKAPNLSDADTFDFLSEYLVVNGSEAKKDPRFLEIEQSYVKPRFLTAPNGMEPDELRNLTNKYGRTGEATKAYVEENAACKQIADKIRVCTSYTDFQSKKPNGGGPDKFTPDQWGLIFRLDGLFRLVWEKFDREFNFSEKFKQFKEAIKTKDPLAGKLSFELITLLKDKFPGGGYGYNAVGRCEGFEVHWMDESGEQREPLTVRYAVKNYIATIEGLSKPFWKEGFQAIINGASQIEDVKEAYRKINEGFQLYISQIADSHEDLKQEAHRMMRDAIQNVLTPKLNEQMSSLTKIQDIKDFCVKMFPNEMRGYRYPHPPIYREDSLPSWAKAAILGKMDELRVLKDTLRSEKKEKNLSETKHFSPKREYDKWLAERATGETPDPQDKVINFILASPSYNIAQRLSMAIMLHDVHEKVEAWILDNAGMIQDYKLVEYMEKHHPEDWPKLEAASPSLLHNPEYVEYKYKEIRIPSWEPELLRINPGGGLSNQIKYIKEHMDGERWPELEEAIIAEVNRIDWNTNNWRLDPTRFAEAVLEYAKEVIKGRWPEIEDKFFDSELFGMKYLYYVLPDAKERIKKLMIEQHGEKTSTKRLFASVRKELEKL